jgi:hypothetical protein
LAGEREKESERPAFRQVFILKIRRGKGVGVVFSVYKLLKSRKKC